jgi:hypothetical protein
MVLTHLSLHGHTRGINSSAYGEFLFSIHFASAVLRNPTATLPALSLQFLSNSTSLKQVVRSFITSSFYLVFPIIIFYSLASAAKDIFQ